MTTKQIIVPVADLGAAEAGSYYTIAGAGGDLQEWIQGYEKLLADHEIGKPVQWFQATGYQVNDYAQPTHPSYAFKPEVTFLLFPLDGLDVGRLAMFKLHMEDRWFDDVVGNMRNPVEGSEPS